MFYSVYIVSAIFIKLFNLYPLVCTNTENIKKTASKVSRDLGEHCNIIGDKYGHSFTYFQL